MNADVERLYFEQERRADGLALARRLVAKARAGEKGLAAALEDLGRLLLCEEELDEARDVFEEALALREGAGESPVEALHGLGASEEKRSPVLARRWFRRALAALGDRVSLTPEEKLVRAIFENQPEDAVAAIAFEPDRAQVLERLARSEAFAEPRRPRRAARHAREAERLLRPHGRPVASKRIELLFLVAAAETSVGRLEPARRALERATAVAGRWSRGSELHVESLARLGKALADKGAFARACRTLEERIALLDEVGGESSPAAAWARISLARYHAERSFDGKGQALLEDVAARENLPPGPRARALAELAAIARRRGRWERAVALLARTRAALLDAHGSPDVADVAALDADAKVLRDALAFAASPGSDLENAEQLEQAATVALAAGEGALARKTILGALLLRERLQGEEHADLVPVLALLGEHAYRDQDWSGGRAAFARASRIADAALGPTSAGALRALVQLATFERWVDRPKRSRALVEERLALLSAEGARADPDALLAALGALASYALEEGDVARARALHESGGEVTRAHPEAEARLDYLTARARFEAEHGTAEAAVACAHEAVSVATERFGPDDLAVADALEILGRNLTAAGRVAEARPHLDRALALAEAAEDATLTARVLVALALGAKGAMRARSLLVRARELYREADDDEGLAECEAHLERLG